MSWPLFSCEILFWEKWVSILGHWSIYFDCSEAFSQWLCRVLVRWVARLSWSSVMFVHSQLDYPECVLKVDYLGAFAVSFWKVFVRYCHMSAYFKFIGHVFIIKLSKSFKGSFFFNINLTYLVLLSEVFISYDLRRQLKIFTWYFIWFITKWKIFNFFVSK